MEFNEMMNEIKEGNDLAFEQLYHMTYNKAYDIAKEMLNDDERIEDALNNAYIRIFSNIKKCNIENEFVLQRYVNTAVRYTCIDYVRREKRKVLCFSDCDVDDDIMVDHSDKFKHLSENELLIKAINELPDNQIIALYLQAYEGLKRSEIAEILDTKEHNVDLYLREARKKLKEKINEFSKN